VHPLETGVTNTRSIVWSTALCLSALTLTACSSSYPAAASHPTSSTSTTIPRNHQTHSEAAVPPAPPNASAIAQYLNEPGNPVLGFERATIQLDGGSVPSLNTCRSVARILGEGAPFGPNRVEKSIRGIASVPIQVSVNADLQNKFRFLGHCLQGKATLKDARDVFSSSTMLTKELQQLGVAIN
jgi:hypothetical protein